VQRADNVLGPKGKLRCRRQDDWSKRWLYWGTDKNIINEMKTLEDSTGLVIGKPSHCWRKASSRGRVNNSREAKTWRKHWREEYE